MRNFVNKTKLPWCIVIEPTLIKLFPCTLIQINVFRDAMYRLLLFQKFFRQNLNKNKGRFYKQDKFQSLMKDQVTKWQKILWLKAKKWMNNIIEMPSKPHIDSYNQVILSHKNNLMISCLWSKNNLRINNHNCHYLMISSPIIQLH